jgi:phosphoesterase RecJ-like protein
MTTDTCDVERALRAWSPLELPLMGRKEAAVLIPLLEIEGRLHVLLTRRSSSLAMHAGEVCLPGGAVEPGEDSLAAALREAGEETGLAAAHCRLLGTLDDTVTITGYRIRPHVVMVEGPFDLSPSAGEVERIITLPLSQVLPPQRSYRVFVEGGQLNASFPLFAHGGNIVWGATARILANFGRALQAPGRDDPVEKTFRALIPAILAAHKVILTTHLDPDPDGMGAEVALEELLLALGKEVVIANPEEVPPRYPFISYRSPAFFGEAITPAVADGADLMIVVDTAERGRIGAAGHLLARMAGRLAVLDHHLGGNLEASPLLMERTFCSASEIVYNLLSALGFPFSRRAANALYAGLLFDTHGFRFVSNRSEPFRIGGHLVDLGADAALLQELIFATVPRIHVDVLSIALSRVRYEFGGRWVWSYITAEEISRLGGKPDDAGEISPFFCSIDGVDVATFMRETVPGTFKVSFRSKKDFPIGEICFKLGGGGHANAGGATVASEALPLADLLRPQVEEVLRSPRPKG